MYKKRKQTLGRMEPSLYANPFGYLQCPLTRDLTQADVVVLGVPYDLATSGRAGARSGPAAIRKISSNLTWEEKRWPWRFNLHEKLRIIDYGDLEFPTGDSETFVALLESTAAQVLDAGKTLLCLGGDHFISLPLMRAHARTHGPISIIHFDAHTDTEESDNPYNHGAMFYQGPKEGIIDPSYSVQIGIRTEYPFETHEYLVIDADKANACSAKEVGLAIKQRIQDTPAYVTFDIDCLDPAYAPGTGTPVAGGMNTNKVLQILRELVGCRLIGMDIVEVAPAYDHAEITALAAATIGLEFLNILAAAK